MTDTSRMFEHYFQIGHVYLTSQKTHVYLQRSPTGRFLAKNALGLCLSKETFENIEVAILLLSDGQEVMVVDDMYEAPIWIELSKS